MAKNKTDKIARRGKDGLSKEFKIIAGIVLLLMAFVGISRIVTVILILLGAYLIYQGVKKK